MDFKSIVLKNEFIPPTFMGNDKLDQSKKLKISYSGRPNATEIKTYTIGFFKDEQYIRERDDKKAVLDYVEKIDNLSLDGKKIETAEGLCKIEISVFKTLITTISNDLLLPDDFTMGEE